uniref:Uncharacterized protein n=1 Tax=Anguilla anguilla TaxID=7936 RepID=A0A0E9TFE3_ANGAN
MYVFSSACQISSSL